MSTGIEMGNSIWCGAVCLNIYPSWITLLSCLIFQPAFSSFLLKFSFLSLSSSFSSSKSIPLLSLLTSFSHLTFIFFVLPLPLFVTLFLLPNPLSLSLYSFDNLTFFSIIVSIYQYHSWSLPSATWDFVRVKHKQKFVILLHVPSYFVHIMFCFLTLRHRSEQNVQSSLERVIKLSDRLNFRMLWGSEGLDVESRTSKLDPRLNTVIYVLLVAMKWYWYIIPLSRDYGNVCRGCFGLIYIKDMAKDIPFFAINFV